jgi:hypothetical protein
LEKKFCGIHSNSQRFDRGHPAQGEISAANPMPVFGNNRRVPLASGHYHFAW